MTAPLCLEVCGVSTGYGALRVLWDVNLAVPEGSAVVLLGANGAGKSTLLRAIMGLVPLWDGQILYGGESIGHWTTEKRVNASISYVSEVGIFAQLSVEDNLRVGGSSLSSRDVRAALKRTWEAFPLLEERRRTSAGSLSGGQRKILGLAKALMRHPRLLIMDEPSSGLSPLLVGEMVAALATVRGSHDVTLLLAEQNAKVLDLTDRVSILSGGRNGFEGGIDQFRAQTDIVEQFFGLPADEVITE